MFFTSFESGDAQPLTGQVGSGPRSSPTARARAGFTGLRALRFDGTTRDRLFEVSATTGEHTELSYLVFPESAPGDVFGATGVALNVEFDDGTFLEDRLDPDALYPDQWNLVRRPLPSGRVVRAIRLTNERGTGWIDDVRIAERPPRQLDAVDWVRTTRGSHSSQEYSRGNTFPATAVPHGFNFWTPVTDASSKRWIYEYHRRNNAANRSVLEAFALSHQPSPHMGDRHTLHVIPSGHLAFGHENETDRPHHYGVRFDGGLTVDVAPTEHAAVFRFAFPGPAEVRFRVGRGRIRVGRNGAVGGHTSVRSRLSVGARRMYVYGTFDRPGHARGTALRFDVSEVRLRIATSLISVAQARRNLDAEIPEGTTFEQVRDAARKQWQELLGRVDVEGATDDQRTTFYSCLYRLFLYPNTGAEDGRHSSPVTRRKRVFSGPMSVNNGFWDTYRTTWPAYALLTPRRCGQLIEGFVQQFREGGWIARWSSPGYADLMTGTSSDVAFADAYLKGVRGFDADAAYQAALRNATVPSRRRGTGRKGLHESIFLGFTPLTTNEGMSWALEGCVNDFGLAGFARALGHEDEARYFRQRALTYVNHFDERIGFFQGRHHDGRWRWPPEHYDPARWGFDCTETDGWTMAFAVPHDGNGLANLYGGRAGLESKLDTYFATPETGRNTGSYGGIIHEMSEARDMRMGQYGHSNQPAHHVAFLYHHAGAPAKAQAVVRRVLTRCYSGGEIGQGYPGDEDNGEMSAWYVFAALGMYPLAVGSPVYVLVAPLFPKATIRLENGNRVTITTTGTGPYVQNVRLNGAPYERAWITHEDLLDGARLDFEAGPEPSGWGTPPPSLTEGDGQPRPLTDLTKGTPGALFDDTSGTQVTFRTRTPVLEYTVEGQLRPVEMYTLTAGTRATPVAWTLEGSPDGRSWTVLDERDGETFTWTRQTRPFALSAPAAYRHYRLRVRASSGRRPSLAQWELLAS